MNNKESIDLKCDDFNNNVKDLNCIEEMNFLLQQSSSIHNSHLIENLSEINSGQHCYNPDKKYVGIEKNL